MTYQKWKTPQDTPWRATIFGRKVVTALLESCNFVELHTSKCQRRFVPPLVRL